MFRTLVVCLATLPAFSSAVHAQAIVTLPAADVPLNNQPRQLYAVGRSDGGTPDVFGDVRAVAFDGAGNLHVLDATNRRVVVFDAGGRYVRHFGRSGRGPGELTAPSALAVAADGTVVIRDSGARGFHVFDRTGAFQRQISLSDELPRPTGRLAIGGSGLVTEGLQLLRQQGLDHVPILVYPLGDGGKGSVHARMPARAPEFRQTGASSFSINMGTKLWAMTPQWAVLPAGRLATAHVPAYEIAVVNADGKVERLVRRPSVAARPFSARDRAAALEQEKRNLTEDGGPRAISSSGGSSPARQLSAAEVEQRLKALEFTEVVPAIRALASDPEGRLWVLRSGSPVTREGAVDVLGADLRYIGTLPPQSLPVAFGPDGRAAYIEKDEYDVPRVVVRQFVF